MMKIKKIENEEKRIMIAWNSMEIYSKTRPTDIEIENIKKVMHGAVELIMLKNNIRKKDIAADIEIRIKVMKCPSKKGFIVGVHSEYGIWVYDDINGTTRIYKLDKKNKKK